VRKSNSPMDRLGKEPRRLGLCAIAAAILLVSVSKSGVVPQAKGEASQSGAAQLSVGSVTSNKYTNDSVGMTYVFPQGWFVDAAAMAAAKDAVKKYAATHGSDDRSKDYQGSVWLVVSKFAEKPNAKPGSFVSGPSIILSGSTVYGPDERKTAAEIQNAAKQQLESKDRLVSVTGPTDFSIGSQSFSRIDRTISGFIYWSDAVTIRNHVRIDFQFMADSTTQLEDLYRTLNTLEFRKPD
jgi:hypothetical protein